MKATDDALVTLTTAADEFEAQLLVNVLNDHGIAANSTGAFTSQFRAEAPGSVRVLVKSADLEAARSVVEQARNRAEPPPADDPRAATFLSKVRAIAILTFVTMLLLTAAGMAIALWSRARG